MAEYKAVYKCRLCGARLPWISVNEERAESHMAEMTAGILSVTVPRVTQTRVHYCGGDHAGSLGLADFQGWEKED